MTMVVFVSYGVKWLRRSMLCLRLLVSSMAVVSSAVSVSVGSVTVVFWTSVWRLIGVLSW